MLKANDESMINHEERIMSVIKLTSIIRSTLYGYSGAIHTRKRNYNISKHCNSNSSNNRKKAISKNCTTFTNYLNEINNKEVDDAPYSSNVSV